MALAFYVLHVGLCDVCSVGSVLVEGQCAPCAPSCQTCHDAGAGSCDVCVDGFFVDAEGSSKGKWAP
jgi:hypothetical protein